MMPRTWIGLSLCLAASAIIVTSLPSASGQDKTTIDWQEGPCLGALGDIGKIKIPEGYRFAGKQGAQKVLELTQNPADGDELGVVIPDTKDDKNFWYAIFEFAQVGYVKDNEKDSLDKDAILTSIESATEESNKTLLARGWAAFHVSGWATPPFYNPATNNLTWAINGYAQDSKGREESTNYSVRILGRQGTMKVDLVVVPDQSSRAIPEFESLLQGFSYVPGKRYSDFRPGDEVSKYGLTGLILGGAVAVAAKTGLLAKFWKLLVLIAAAILSALKKFLRFLKRVFTGKAAEEEQEAVK